MYVYILSFEMFQNNDDVDVEVTILGFYTNPSPTGPDNGLGG